ncbi:ABC transporter ATP-binding protein [Skermanella pratensis]|uniref:ABC transporter ATP-binding protein n=1 Tax=Skermanella pratensis TaxID=2233999 RepID=UPI001300F056|nr:ABC transporter ATP-binding protein [Skermanella pratensis]
MSDVHIDLNNVSVEFPVYNAHGRSLKRSLMNMTTGGHLGLGKNDRIVVRALQNITLSFEHGDRVALIGHNGAGKTTMLRVLAGAYEPTAGQIVSSGRIAALSDIMLGIDAESTGHENISIRGRLLGLDHRQIERLRPEIAEFSGLGDYLDIPVRTYSSGMILRLAFAVSTSVVPDILLLDEWIGAGDATFLSKAEERLDHLVGNSGILVLATHSLALTRRVCNRAVWMEHGSVRAEGPIEEVIRAYETSLGIPQGEVFSLRQTAVGR